jgi:hypothetical protein
MRGILRFREAGAEDDGVMECDGGMRGEREVDARCEGMRGEKGKKWKKRRNRGEKRKEGKAE